MSHATRSLRLALSVLLIAVSSAQAAEFRQITIIARPTPPPAGFETARTVSQPAFDLVERAVRDFFAKWNRGDLSGALSKRFFDADRLSDQIALSAPRDAKIRLLSLRSISVLEQFARAEDGGSELVMSKLSVIAQTAVEFNDPTTGFQRFEGTHEYLFDLTTRRRR